MVGILSMGTTNTRGIDVVRIVTGQAICTTALTVRAHLSSAALDTFFRTGGGV